MPRPRAAGGEYSLQIRRVAVINRGQSRVGGLPDLGLTAPDMRGPQIQKLVNPLEGTKKVRLWTNARLFVNGNERVGSTKGGY